MLREKNQAATKLGRKEAGQILEEHGIPASKLDAIQAFNESAHLAKGANIYWSNNAGK